MHVKRNGRVPHNAAAQLRAVRLEGARKRALQLHLKEAKRDDFLKHRARQLQRLVIQPYSDALAQRAPNPDSTMRGRAVFFKRVHYEFSNPGGWSPNG
jgi:hypothetical protein